MGKNTIIAGVLGCIVGLVVGFVGANYLNTQQDNQAAAIQTPQQGPLGAGHQNPAAATDPKMLEDVQKTLDKAKASPNDKIAQLEAGEMYFKIQKLDEALGFFQKAHDADPEGADTNKSLAKVYFEKKEYSTAAKHFEAAIKASPKEPGLLSDLGLSYYLREPKQVDEAIGYYEKALALEPKFEPALQNLVIAMREKGDADGLKKAMASLRDVNENNPALKAPQ